MNGTPSLKALASAVLQRNTRRNTCGTLPASGCSIRAEHPPFDGVLKSAQNRPETAPKKVAETWLLDQLSECPKSIAWLYHEWTPSPTNPQRMKDADRATLTARHAELTEAKQSLGAVSFVRDVPDERGWKTVQVTFWRLPEQVADEADTER